MRIIRGEDMTQQRDYLTGLITLLLAILILFSIVPVVGADDDYLDGGFMGVPAWLGDLVIMPTYTLGQGLIVFGTVILLRRRARSFGSIDS